MKSVLRPAIVGLTTAFLTIVGMVPPALAETRARHHRQARAHRGMTGTPATDGAGMADAARNGAQARGLYAGAGGMFSPDYQVPDPGTIRLGAQLLGGDFGKAYEDYYRHYYYYKYAYCPIGTGYVIYLRRCVGIGNLFQ